MSPPGILIVEDENIVAMDIGRGLRRLGYGVVGRATRGEEAVELARLHRPALVLMDIRLKGPLDGVAAAGRIRGELEIPVLFLTAYADDATLQRAMAAEPFGYLLKPFEERELHTAIEIALNKHSAVSRAQSQTREALRQAQEQLQLFVDSVRDYAIFLLDADGRVMTWNPAAERIHGYPPGEVLGRNSAVFYSAEDVRAGVPARALATAAAEGRHQAETWRVRWDGSGFWADVALTAIHDPSGRLQGFGEVTRDITDRRAAEQRIRDLNAELEQRVRDRTAELESFSYSVSHDLRAPLRGIDGYIRMLQEDFGGILPPEAARLLGVVSSEARRMGQLIDDLLGFSRLGRQTMSITEVDLGALVSGVFDGMVHGIASRVPRLQLQPLPPVPGDVAMLRQVFANLIGNSVKFSRRQPDPVIEVGGRVDEGHVTCFVRDNGVGFDSRYAHKLFQVFQRLHSEEEFEGTGVGLAIVHRVIQRHGGRVWAEGAPGKGATFSFTLPLRSAGEGGS
jgi:PAS domain S-box-containing protein